MAQIKGACPSTVDLTRSETRTEGLENAAILSIAYGKSNHGPLSLVAATQGRKLVRQIPNRAVDGEPVESSWVRMS